MTSPEATGRAIFVTGSRQGEEFDLGISSITLGSDPNVHVVLSGEEGISPRHATIRFENGRWIVRDQGSASGTYINFRRIHEQELRDGDVVELNLAGPSIRVTVPPLELTRPPPVEVATPAPSGPGPHIPTPPPALLGRRFLMGAGVVVVLGVVAVLYMVLGPGGSGARATDLLDLLEQEERGYLTELPEMRSAAEEDRAAAMAGLDSGQAELERLRSGVASGGPAGTMDSLRARIDELEAAAGSFDALNDVARDRTLSLVLIQAGFQVDGDYISGPTGTGFAVPGEGLIVTNLHVAQPHLFALSSEEAGIGCVVGALEASGVEVEAVLSVWHAGAALHYLATGALDPASATWSTRDGSLEILGSGATPSSDDPIQCESEGDGAPPVTVRRAQTSAESDLVVLAVRGTELPVLELAEERPAAGDPVVTLGFPRGLLPPENGEVVPEVSVGTVERVSGALLVDDELLEGGDGSAILDSAGRVLGISAGRVSGRMMAIHAEYIRGLLERLR